MADGSNPRQHRGARAPPRGGARRGRNGRGLRRDPREIEERDQRDASRDVAPMVPAPDAMIVDSSTQTLEEVVDSLASTVDARRRGGRGEQ